MAKGLLLLLGIIWVGSAKALGWGVYVCEFERRALGAAK